MILIQVIPNKKNDSYRMLRDKATRPTRSLGQIKPKRDSSMFRQLATSRLGALRAFWWRESFQSLAIAGSISRKKLWEG